MAPIKKKKIKVNEDAQALSPQEWDVPTDEVELSDDAVGSGDGLRLDLQEARQQVEEMQDRILRVAAEFDNYKKRMERERATSLKYAEEHILKELLPTIDNLERAIEQGSEADSAAILLEGVTMTLSGLREMLKKFGVTPLESIGASFDPNFHEAVAMEASAEVDANTVFKEFQKGYQYKERLLRPAKVIVSSGS